MVKRLRLAEELLSSFKIGDLLSGGRAQHDGDHPQVRLKRMHLRSPFKPRFSISL